MLGEVRRFNFTAVRKQRGLNGPRDQIPRALIVGSCTLGLR